MKLYSALILCLVAGAASAQSINNSTDLQTANFNISGTGRAYDFRTTQETSSGGNVHYMMQQAPGGSPRWGIGTNTTETGVGNVGSNFSIYAYGADYLGEYLTINRATAYVGLCYRNPTHSLHIGALAANSNSMRFGIPGDAGNTNVLVGSPTGGYNIDFNTWRDIIGDQIGARLRVERINIYQDNNAMVQGSDFVFYTSQGLEQSYLLERMRINSNGFIGIGTAKPTYELTVKGTIGARKVKVTQETWADFVFRPDYNLPSLKEVEDHIAEHQHLPGIPSEKEVRENGVDVGDMDAKLLQKIEELTLYIIELNKKIEKLEKSK